MIFSIELWERFGFYGLQGIMAVYLVKMLGLLSEAESITPYYSFSALVFGFVAICGWLGDIVLGSKTRDCAGHIGAGAQLRHGSLLRS
ncbi:hypothetical protein M5G07_10935 [Serratia symbiotica]|nr:hypothetical protein [Serratia symbiotica]